MRTVRGMMEGADMGIDTTFHRRPYHCSTKPDEYIEMIEKRADAIEMRYEDIYMISIIFIIISYKFDNSSDK
jgi:hypothetical protein